MQPKDINAIIPDFTEEELNEALDGLIDEDLSKRDRGEFFQELIDLAAHVGIFYHAKPLSLPPLERLCFALYGTLARCVRIEERANRNWDSSHQEIAELSVALKSTRSTIDDLELANDGLQSKIFQLRVGIGVLVLSTIGLAIPAVQHLKEYLHREPESTALPTQQEVALRVCQSGILGEFTTKSGENPEPGKLQDVQAPMSPTYAGMGFPACDLSEGILPDVLAAHASSRGRSLGASLSTSSIGMQVLRFTPSSGVWPVNKVYSIPPTLLEVDKEDCSRVSVSVAGQNSAQVFYERVMDDQKISFGFVESARVAQAAAPDMDFLVVESICKTAGENHSVPLRQFLGNLQ